MKKLSPIFLNIPRKWLECCVDEISIKTTNSHDKNVSIEGELPKRISIMSMFAYLLAPKNKLSSLK
jgi:hypothetical protein